MDNNYEQVLLDLRKSLAWLDLALATLHEGVIVLDGDMKVVFANDAIANMLEKPRVLLLGSPAWEIAGLRNEEKDLSMDEYLDARKKNAVELLSGVYELETASKTVSSVEMTAAHIANTKHTVLVVRDITERLQAQAQRVRIAQEQAAREAAQVSERRMLMQYEVASVLAGPLEYEAAITRILSIVCENLKWKAGVMWTLGAETQKLQFASFWTDDSEMLGEFIQESQKRFFSKGEGLPGKVWDKRKPVWDDDVSSADNFPRRQVADKSDLHAAFAVPLYNGEDFIGVMEFYSNQIQKSDMELLTSMATVGMQIGEYMRRKSIEKLTTSLREQRTRLLELNRAKDEFISLASHQLRTPATGVKQFLGMLVEGYGGDLSETQKRFAEKAYESNERQITIVNDLLKVAQVDAGKVTLKKEKIALDSLILNVLEEQRSKFAEREQKVSFENEINRLKVPVDAKHYRMAIENIVDNASKYTEPGKDIEVRVYRDGDYAVTRVKDRGVGIPKGDLSRIFNKFTRVENQLSALVGGSGLGLYWCKKIIELHGGRIDVASSVGKGTAFIVSVPIK